MNVRAEVVADIGNMRKAIAFAYDRPSSQGEAIAYQREHSIIRLNQFAIYMRDIPSKVSVHLVRHAAVGQFHLVGSNRGDWNDRGEMTLAEWDKTVNRGTPVRHYMMLNAQHLIDMSRKRLCKCSESSTRVVMQMIKDAIEEVDTELPLWMVPECWYRGGICKEEVTCGHYKRHEEYVGWTRRSL